MNPQAQIVKATRDLVDGLLAMNTSNRNPKKTVIDAYCRDIEAGHWMLTNQGIGVTSDGVLLDGQHRLMALKSCGYPPIEILLVTGLNPAAQIAVDAHAKRTARDILNIAFNTRVNVIAPAIGNLLMLIEERGWGSGRVTNAELFDKIAAYMIEIEAVTSVPKVANYFSAPFLAAFCKAMKEQPDRSEDIKAFMRRVELGEMLTRTMPEFHLRAFVTLSKQTGNSGGGSQRRERYEKTIKALIASLDGKPMGVLRA
jgi:hypothetical protein